MGGKSTTSTQQLQIPPEVLARYNAVNARAEQAGQTPFQNYSLNPNAFVAPINAQQQAGIGGVNAAANQAQPYFGAATGQLLNAQQQAMPFYGLAQNALTAGQGMANQLQTAANQDYLGAFQSAQPYNQQATSLYNAALAAAQPYNQQAGANIAGAQAGASPYQALATQYGLAGGQAVNAGQLGAQQINQYMSPYLQNVVGSEQQLLNQQNQQAMSGQLGTAIQSGAFGGDRAGIAAANLAQQQQLANANIYSNLLNQGYGQALGVAQQQQGVTLSAEQANRAAQQQAAQQMLGIGQQGFGQGITAAQAQQGLGQQVYGQAAGTGQNLSALGNQMYTQGMGLGQAQQGLGGQYFNQGLQTSQQEQALGQGLFGMGNTVSQGLQGIGTGAQNAAMQGAQGQMAAGTMQQQTAQAGLQALYNQFMQSKSYPFQIAQFLANIAEGTGALSGSTQTTTQPGGFFSDERLKENIEPIGKTFDGQTIHKYNYKGASPNETQIGLLAQDVEKHHPHAVGLAGGYKTVNYDTATADAAHKGHFYQGGIVPSSMGGHVSQEHMGESYGFGGSVALPGLSSADMSALIESQQKMYMPYSGSGPLGAGPIGGVASHVPPATLPVSHLATPEGGLRRPTSPAQTVENIDKFSQSAQNLNKDVQHLLKTYGPTSVKPTDNQDAINSALDTSNANQTEKDIASSASNELPDIGSVSQSPERYGGGVVGHYASGGMPYEEDPSKQGIDIPEVAPGAKLATPSGGSQGGSGSSVMGDVMTVANIAAMFMADGGVAGAHGRHGYAGDGTVTNDDSQGQYSGVGNHSSEFAGSTLANIIGSALQTSPNDRTQPIADSIGKHNLQMLDQKTALTGGQSAPVAAPPAVDPALSVAREASANTPVQNQAVNLATQSAPTDPEQQNRASFERAWPVVKSHEGTQYVPDGAGSFAKFGINSVYHPDVDVKNLTEDQAKDIAYNQYWKPHVPQDASQEFKNAAFDTVYHVGQGAGSRLIKESSGDLNNLLDLQQGYWNLKSADQIKADPVNGVRKWAKLMPAFTNRIESFRPENATGQESTVPASTGPTGGVVAAPDLTQNDAVAPTPAGGVVAAPQNIPDTHAAVSSDTTSTGVAPSPAPERPSENEPHKDGFFSRLLKSDYLVPGLRTLGAIGMAPTRNLGVALSAGAMEAGNALQQQKQFALDKAYKEAETGFVGANTLHVMSGIPNEAFITDPNTKAVLGVKVFDRNNNAFTVSLMEFLRNRGKYRIAPTLKPVTPPADADATSVDSAAPATAPAPDATGASPVAKVASTEPIYRSIPADLQDMITNRAEAVTTNPQMMSTQPENNPFTQAAEDANVARNTAITRNQLLRAFVESDPKNSGQFAATIKNPLLSWVRSSLTAFGVPEQYIPTNADQLANQETITKIQNQLAMSNQAATGGRAFREFSAALATIPGSMTSRNGQAKLMSSIFGNAVRDIDKDTFYNLYRDALTQKGVPAANTAYTGRGLEQEFTTRQGGVYEKEKSIFENMFNKTITPPGATAPVPLISYLIANGGNVPDPVKKYISTTYNTKGYNPLEILRWFGGR
jgi:hypothetical protein